MKYREEKYANELHHDLTQRFAASLPVATLSVEGAGVHWECTAQRGVNFCATNCFDANGPEYLSVFKRDSEAIAWGRTSSKSDTINAIDLWLQGHELAALSTRLPFVDQSKRVLLKIQVGIKRRFPPLIPVDSGLQHQVCDIYYLRFQNGEQSCQISFYGKNKFPDAVFYWDECELFRFNADSEERLAGVVNCWVGDQISPSEMRAEFPWLEIGKLADAYENGNPIEGEFVQSWDTMERFYDEIKYPLAPEANRFIAQMRARGYDKTLRAGQSMWTFVLSRSRRHGLGRNQTSICFDFHAGGMDISTDLDHEQKTYPIELTPEVDALLQKLEAQKVD